MNPTYSRLACLLAPLLTACGGGGSDEAPLAAPAYTLNVSLPESGTLCVNLNQNTRCDEGEPSVSGVAGARQLSGTAPALLTSPLLFLPTNPAAPALLHPAARLDGQTLTPSLLSTLLQSSIAEGHPPKQALDEMLAALAPLQPGQGLAALSQLADFNLALGQLLLAVIDAEPETSDLSPVLLQAVVWPALGSLLPELASHFAQHGELTSLQESVTRMLQQQYSHPLVTGSGVTTYTDGVDYLLTEEPADHPGQEASLGKAPLRYRKLDGKGQPLPDDAPQWECVEDLTTRLVWERKLNDAKSPRDLHRTFAWELGDYHPTQQELDYACQQGEAICTTEQYRQWLNAQQLCGITSWRMPHSRELMSLQHYGSLARQYGQLVTMDVRYFPDVGTNPNMVFNGYYWSQTLTPSRRLESAPLSAIAHIFLGDDAGTDYATTVQNSNDANGLQLRLVAEVIR
ncbi:DUF1566 domain-containing protein [Aeromonas salmonicida]|uniref:Lcl C-terminal domain-containing protein n=1 Tax=Aeromonas salmonicida TaxID=645 RepID=UPI003D232AE9